MDLQNKPRGQWSLIDEITGKGIKGKGKLPLGIGNRELPKPFNDYFLRVGQRLGLDNSINTACVSNYSNLNSIVISEIALGEMMRTIHGLRNCAPGPDEISVPVLKIPAEEQREILLEQIKIIMCEGRIYCGAKEGNGHSHF